MFKKVGLKRPYTDRKDTRRNYVINRSWGYNIVGQYRLFLKILVLSAAISIFYYSIRTVFLHLSLSM